MTIDVAELGSTFVLGTVALLALDAILVGLLGSRGIGFFAGRWGYEYKTETALFVGAALVIGLIAEDFSYRLVDDRNTPFLGPYRFAHVHVVEPFAAAFNLPAGKVLIRRNALRASVLLDDEGGDDELKANTFGIRPLGRELGCRHALERSDVVFVRPDGQRVPPAPVDAWLCSSAGGTLPADVGVASGKELRDLVERLFYHAKNSTYRVEALNGELRKIESRASFARSLGLVAFGFLVLVLPLGPAACVVWTIDRALRRFLVRLAFVVVFVAGVYVARLPTSPGNAAAGFVCVWLVVQCAACCFLLWLRRADCEGRSDDQKRVASARLMTVGLPFLLGLLYFGGLYANLREQEEFNKRVFGYYSESLARTFARPPAVSRQVVGVRPPAE